MSWNYISKTTRAMLGKLTTEQRRRIQPPRQNISGIVLMIERNRDAGLHFFSDDSLRFFDSQIHGVYEGPGGVYLVDSVQFHDWSKGWHGERAYKVRRQELDGKRRGAFNTLAEPETLEAAIEAAEVLARGEAAR